MARVETGIAFAERNGVALRGDLYKPDHGWKHPVLVGVPGGAWLRGDKADLAHWGARLAEAGVALFSIDYRRSTDGKVFPENAQDILAAVRFVREHASALGVDKDRIGLLGASAGAHLAALVALAGEGPLIAGVDAGRAGSSALRFLRVLVGVYGVYDLAEHWRACHAAVLPEPDEMADRMMGAPLTGNEQSYAAASPISHVSKNILTLRILLVHGDADVTVRPEQTELFATCLRAAGVSPETIRVPGAAHFWFSKEKDTYAGHNGAIAPHLIQFLQDNLF